MKTIMSNAGPVKSALLDGYSFGDRILEGVIFRVTIDENGEVQVKEEEPDHPYNEVLNMKKWLKKAKIFAEEADVLSHPDRPHEEDVWIEDTAP